MIYRSFGKRAFDLSLAAVLLILFAPLMAAVAVLQLLLVGRPVLFTQRRPGKNECLFRILKFRTLGPATSCDGKRLTDAERLTRLGAILRVTSFDELPQLWNIVRGDMSFVGPRPLLEEYLPLYTDEERERHSVPPGITGWAQINGRNTLEAHRRLALDLEYARNVSLNFDMKILAGTVIAVFTRKGVEICPDPSANPLLRRKPKPAAGEIL